MFSLVEGKILDKHWREAGESGGREWGEGGRGEKERKDKKGLLRAR